MPARPALAAVPAQPAPSRSRRGRSPAPEPALGSIVTSPGATATCRACGSTRVMEIGLAGGDGARVAMVSCRDCEHRDWIRDGAVVPAAAALGAAS